MQKRKRQKLCLLAAGAALALALAGCGQETAVEAVAHTAAWDAVQAQEGAEAYDAYKPYGLRYDPETERLYYQDQRVRYFADLYPVDWDHPENSGQAGRTFFDPEGVVDVLAQRDLSEKQYRLDGSYDPAGVLNGLTACSQAEFDARDLEPLLHPPMAETHAGEQPLTPEELATLFAPYGAFGLAYDAAADTLFFQGQRVRRFTDVLATNGEPLHGGGFRGTLRSLFDERGSVDVEAVRRYERLDGQTEGTLAGLRICKEKGVSAGEMVEKREGIQ